MPRTSRPSFEQRAVAAAREKGFQSKDAVKLEQMQKRQAMGRPCLKLGSDVVSASQLAFIP